MIHLLQKKEILTLYISKSENIIFKNVINFIIFML